MKIAVPVHHDMKCAPFESCDEFALFEIEGTRIATQTTLPQPEGSDCHAWLRSRGVNLVLTARMAASSRDRFGLLGMRVVTDVPTRRADELTRDYLLGQMASA